MDEKTIFSLLRTLIPVRESRKFRTFQKEGVTFVDPAATYVSEESIHVIRIGNGTVILPNVYLIGNIFIEEDCKIWPNVYLIGSITIRAGCIIWPNITIYNSTVGSSSRIGRPQIKDSQLGEGVTVGAFAEIVRSTLEDEVNMRHFSYTGDAVVGKGSNGGAGMVTANFGAEGKKQTHIGPHSFLGVNSSYVAPLLIGEEAFIGAGSVITKDVAPHAVVVGVDRVLPGKKSYHEKGRWRIVADDTPETLSL